MLCGALLSVSESLHLHECGLLLNIQGMVYCIEGCLILPDPLGHEKLQDLIRDVCRAAFSSALSGLERAWEESARIVSGMELQNVIDNTVVYTASFNTEKPNICYRSVLILEF